MSVGRIGIGGAGAADLVTHHDPVAAEAPTAGRVVRTAGPAPDLPRISPMGTYILAGQDPVRGNFRGEVTIAPGAKPGEARVTYHATFADGREGTISGTASYDKQKLWMNVPISKGTGAFSAAANPGAKPNSEFELRTIWDLEHGNATGFTEIRGAPATPGVRDARAIYGIARPFPGIATIMGGASGPAASAPASSIAGPVGAVDDYVDRLNVSVSIPVKQLSNVALTKDGGLKLSSPADNRFTASLNLDDGAGPQVGLHFDKPLVVKGPWYQPDVEIRNVWMENGKVKTDASFSQDALDKIPGLRGLPDRFAGKAIAKATESFEPLMHFLSARASDGKMPDADAMAAAIQEAMKQGSGAGGAGAASPLDGKLDLGRATVQAIAFTQKEIEIPMDGSVLRAKARTRIYADIPVDLAKGRPGALTLRFDPPVDVLPPAEGNVGVAIAAPEVRSIKLTPDGFCTIEGGAGVFDPFFLPDMGREAARITALLTVVYNELPPESDIAKALKQAGIGPR